jgi:hypothetical protein
MRNVTLIGAICALAGSAASAQESAFIDFDSEPLGSVPNGFISDDSPLVSFSDLGAGELEVGDFGVQSDGPSLVNFAETPLRLSFVRPVTNLAMLMGDDDSGFLGGADVFTKIVGFRDGVAVAERIIQNNGDDIINDGPSIEGIFDAVEVEFTTAAGVPHPAVPEIIDSVSFAVANGAIDFDSDAPGPVPNGFRSDDSSIVAFSSGNLSILEFGTGKTDGPSLANIGSGPLVMDFDRPVTEFSCRVGNDDTVFTGAPVFSTLRGYRDGALIETVIFANNGDDLINDGPAIRGVFDRIEFVFTDAAGVDSGLAEIIDNIAFATASQFIDFESDATGTVPNGFMSDDSPIVGFGDTDASGLQIVNSVGGKGDGRSLYLFPDDDASIRMQFEAPVSTFTLEFGNDDPSRAPVFATLRGYKDGSQTRSVTTPTASDNLLNQSMSIAGSFDAVEFQYTNMDGSPITNGLIEVVDNIRFSVEKQLVDFNDDPAGSVPNGFVSNDSALVAFRDSIGEDLQIGDFGSKTDGQGLVVVADDDSALRMGFVTPVNSLSLDFGNDDPSRAPVFATMRTFLGNIPQGTVTIAANNDDIMNQTIRVDGFFDRAEFKYTDANGGPIPDGLIEVVDNICFVVATGSTPCNPADLAEPFGVLDLSDINVFVAAFTGQTPAGDLDQNGIFDLTDINLFVTAFTSGCP